MLLEDTGTVKASYGYQPYGEADPQLTQGDTDVQKPLNPYRYTGKRLDSGSGSLDTGSRRFNPGSTRFLQQDLFRSSLSDLALGVDPITQNRYSLAAGNPTSFIEWDGHRVLWDGRGGSSNATYDSSTPYREGGVIPPCSGETCGTRRGSVWSVPGDCDGCGPEDKASVFVFRAPKLPGKGVTFGGHFIAAEGIRAGAFFFGPVLRGDNRDPSPHANPAQYRVFWKIDFDKGFGILRSNPTCWEGQCRAAHDINGGISSAFVGRMKNGTVALRYSLRSAAFNGGPAIDGLLFIPATFKDPVRFVHERFPSAEVYHERAGRIDFRYSFEERPVPILGIPTPLAGGLDQWDALLGELIISGQLEV